MKPIDILYTPLKVDPVPDFDLEKLNQWMLKNYKDAEQYSKAIITDEGVHGENYPWDINHAYYDMKGDGPGWMNNFDKEFPELAEHLSTALGIPLSEYGEILFLPIREKHEGFGFWHQDPDLSGIRLYLEFEDMESNKLLMRRTIEPYTERFTLKQHEYINSHLYLEPEIIECKVSDHRQWFYLNNDRAVHSTWTTTKKKNRIAVIVSGRPGDDKKFIDGVESLIVESSKHFKDYALFWDKNIQSDEKHFKQQIDFRKMIEIYPKKQ